MRGNPPGDLVVGVSEFKRRCLELVEQMRRRGRAVVITKRGEPVARLTPLRPSVDGLRGSLKDAIVVRGDIVNCDWTDDWEASR